MELHPDPVVSPELATFVSGGVVIVAATRDADLRPELTRAWGPLVSADGAAVTLCLNAAPGSRMVSNLEGNGAIAVTFVLPTTYRGVQMKGTVLGMREPTAEELTRVEEHVAAFVDQVEQVGVPANLARRLVQPEFVAVTFAVRELYDQTPGPGAGARL
jgi:hypothetical protein